MARLVIDVVANAAKATATLKGLEGAAAGISGKLSSVRAPAAAALGGIAVGAFKAVGMASDLNETVSKSGQIFGKNAGSIDKWASGSAKAFGLSKEAALSSAAGFGDMFSQIGFAGDQAADMSKSVVQMSADLGSFNNLETSDVTDRMSAAFRGEYDSLQALIPNINAARVEAEAMAATGKKSAKELTAQEKATAVLAIVQKDGAKAAGDFSRTQDGAANKSKIAKAQAADLAANLGQRLLPAYAAALEGASRFLDFLSQHQGGVTAAVVAIAALAAILLVASAATTIYNGVKAVSSAARWAADAVAASKSAAVQRGANDRITASMLATKAKAGAGLVATWVAAGAAAVKSAAVQVAANVRVGASWVAVQAKAIAASVAGWATAAASAVASAAIQVAALVRVGLAWIATQVKAVAAGALVVAQWLAGAAAATASAAIQVAANVRAAASYAIQRGAMLAGVAAMAVVKGATIAFTAAQWLLNAALTANPIGIIIVAIGLLIAGLVLAYRNSETFRNIVTGAFRAVAAVASVVWNFIKTAAVAVWSFITGYIRMQIAAIVAVFNAVKAVALFVWNTIKIGATVAWNAIKAVVTGAINNVKAVINAYKAVVLAVWTTIKTGATTAFNAIKAVITAVVNAAKGKFDELKALATSVLARIKSIFSPGALLNAGRQLIEGLARGISEKIGAAVDAVRRGVQKIKDLLPGSPIKDGPLKSWNNGGAGKRLMGLLAQGLRAGAGGVERELSSVLAAISSPTITPTMSLGTTGALDLTGGGSGQTVYHIELTVQAGIGDPVAIGREVSSVLQAYLGAGGRQRAA